MLVCDFKGSRKHSPAPLATAKVFYRLRLTLEALLNRLIC